MDFSQTEERQMLADTLSRFVMQDYPLDARLDAGASEAGFSREKWQQLAELGAVAALFSEEVGGFGGAGFDLSVVFEAIGRGLIVEPFLQSAILAGGALASAGSPDQQQKLEAIISGEKIAALAHFEPDDGADPAFVSATASRDGVGWKLNGHKSVVRNANEADFLIVSARSKGAPGDPDGISLFIVSPDAPGLTLHDYQTIDGGRAAEVSLKDVVVDEQALVGVEGRGAGILGDVLGRGVLCLCAEALGLMDVIKDLTIEYIQTRKQFGVPIGKFQALQHRMAEMLLEIEQARSAVINAAFHVDTPGVDRERALSAAKVTSGQVGTLVVEESIQLHGGMGMTWENSLGHFAKRLMMIGHELGDEEYHLSRYIRLGAG